MQKKKITFRAGLAIIAGLVVILLSSCPFLSQAEVRLENLSYKTLESFTFGNANSSYLLIGEVSGYKTISAGSYTPKVAFILGGGETGTSVFNVTAGRKYRITYNESGNRTYFSYVEE